MLTRSVIVRLVVFVAISFGCIAYLGVHYVGVGRWVGAGGYTAHLDLTNSGGIFSNAEVDYRGVPVGRVGELRLTRTGVQVDLLITSGRRIPSDVEAAIADRSVIGEQYVDLRPRTDSGPYLHDGSTIAARDTVLPAPVQDLMLSADQLASSVPIGALQTTIGELYQATQGLGQQLSTLVTSSDQLFTTLNRVLPQSIDLITTSKTVLATQNTEAGSIQQFARNLGLISTQLKDSNGDISKVLAGITPAATEVTGLINDVQGSLHGLLTNLLTTSAVFYAHKDGVRDVLVNLPVAVTIGGLVTTPQGINVGLVPTFFDPLPCISGYGGTTVRSGLNTAGNPALNTKAACTATGGTDIRGSQHAPGH